MMNSIKKYKMPADFKKKTIQEYQNLNEQYQGRACVSEVYGQMTDYAPGLGGRDYQDLPQVSKSELEKYVKYCNAHGIEFNYVLNGSCMGNQEFDADFHPKFSAFLSELYEMGIRTLTIALTSLLEIIKHHPYPFHVKISVINNITTVNEAKSFFDLGADRVVLSESLNRSVYQLQKIASVCGDQTEIIVNSMCKKNCVYRMAHYNQTTHDSMAGDSKKIRTYYKHRCLMDRAKELGNLAKLCWIRPEDIPKYHALGISNFKIQGRQHAYRGDPVRTAEIYMKENYDGDLLQLLELFFPLHSFHFPLNNKQMDGFIDPFFIYPDWCKDDCESCHYCRDAVAKAVDLNKARHVNDNLKIFFNEYDEFMNCLRQNQ